MGTLETKGNENDGAMSAGDISPTALAAQTRLSTAQSKYTAHYDNYEPTKGAKLSFTFENGLLVMILPNGDVSQ